VLASNPTWLDVILSESVEIEESEFQDWAAKRIQIGGIDAGILDIRRLMERNDYGTAVYRLKELSESRPDESNPRLEALKLAIQRLAKFQIGTPAAPVEEIQRAWDALQLETIFKGAPRTVDDYCLHEVDKRLDDTVSDEDKVNLLWRKVTLLAPVDPDGAFKALQESIDLFIEKHANFTTLNEVRKDIVERLVSLRLPSAMNPEVGRLLVAVEKLEGLNKSSSTNIATDIAVMASPALQEAMVAAYSAPETVTVPDAGGIVVPPPPSNHYEMYLKYQNTLRLLALESLVEAYKSGVPDKVSGDAAARKSDFLWLLKSSLALDAQELDATKWKIANYLIKTPNLWKSIEEKDLKEIWDEIHDQTIGRLYEPVLRRPEVERLLNSAKRSLYERLTDVKKLNPEEDHVEYIAMLLTWLKTHEGATFDENMAKNLLSLLELAIKSNELTEQELSALEDAVDALDNSTVLKMYLMISIINCHMKDERAIETFKELATYPIDTSLKSDLENVVKIIKADRLSERLSKRLEGWESKDFMGMASITDDKIVPKPNPDVLKMFWDIYLDAVARVVASQTNIVDLRSLISASRKFVLGKYSMDILKRCLHISKEQGVTDGAPCLSLFLNYLDTGDVKATKKDWKTVIRAAFDFTNKEYILMLLRRARQFVPDLLKLIPRLKMEEYLMTPLVSEIQKSSSDVDRRLYLMAYEQIQGVIKDEDPGCEDDLVKTLLNVVPLYLLQSPKDHKEVIKGYIMTQEDRREKCPTAQGTLNDYVTRVVDFILDYPPGENEDMPTFTKYQREILMELVNRNANLSLRFFIQYFDEMQSDQWIALLGVVRDYDTKLIALLRKNLSYVPHIKHWKPLVQKLNADKDIDLDDNRPLFYAVLAQLIDPTNGCFAGNAKELSKVEALMCVDVDYLKPREHVAHIYHYFAKYATLCVKNHEAFMVLLDESCPEIPNEKSVRGLMWAVLAQSKTPLGGLMVNLEAALQAMQYPTKMFLGAKNVAILFQKLYQANADYSALKKMVEEIDEWKHIATSKLWQSLKPIGQLAPACPPKRDPLGMPEIEEDETDFKCDMLSTGAGGIAYVPAGTPEQSLPLLPPSVYVEEDELTYVDRLCYLLSVEDLANVKVEEISMACLMEIPQPIFREYFEKDTNVQGITVIIDRGLFAKMGPEMATKLSEKQFQQMAESWSTEDPQHPYTLLFSPDEFDNGIQLIDRLQDKEIGQYIDAEAYLMPDSDWTRAFKEKMHVTEANALRIIGNVDQSKFQEALQLNNPLAIPEEVWYDFAIGIPTGQHPCANLGFGLFTSPLFVQVVHMNKWISRVSPECRTHIETNLLGEPDEKDSEEANDWQMGTGAMRYLRFTKMEPVKPDELPILPSETEKKGSFEMKATSMGDSMLRHRLPMTISMAGTGGGHAVEPAEKSLFSKWVTLTVSVVVILVAVTFVGIAAYLVIKGRSSESSQT
jgi:hypothetical protein